MIVCVCSATSVMSNSVTPWTVACQAPCPGILQAKILEWVLPLLTNNCCMCMLLLLSHFSHVQLCDPIDGSPPGSPAPGIHMQEHWSGLPFPPPMHESEKWKWSRSVVSDPQWPHGLQPSRLLHPWDFPGKSTGVGCIHVWNKLFHRFWHSRHLFNAS